jgi:AraC-like DNA-binding protein
MGINENEDMNKSCRLILFTSMLAMSLFAGVKAFATATLPDSLLTDDNVYEYTFTDFAKAEQIMHELRIRQKLPDFRLDMVEGDLYFNTGTYYRALKFYHRALDNDSVRLDDHRFMEQVHRLISCYDCLHNETRKAQYVDILLNKAEQCGDKAMQSVALFNMGKMLYYQGNKDKGYEYMQRAADLMEETDYTYKYDNLRYNYNTLLVFQELDRRNEEGLRTLEALQKVVTQETGTETPMEGLDEKEKKALYAHYAVVLSRLGRLKEAAAYYDKFMATAKDYDRDNYLIMPYLFDRRMYDEVIRMNSAREKMLATQGDTVTYHMTTIKKSLGRAYEEKGDYRTATRYFKELAVLRDSVKSREQKSAALELAALYETHEKDLLLQQQTADARVRNIGLSLAGCVIVLLIALLWFFIRNNRIIESKNTAMVRTIEDLLAYKKELATARIGLAEEAEAEPEPEPPYPAEEPVPGKEEEENRRLYKKLDAIVTTRQLFLNQNLSREELMKLIRVDKNRFSRILQQNTNKTMLAYLNDKRMEYAAELLKTHPDYNIATVAQLCGTSVSTFNRMFKNKYGMTPAEFRGKTQPTDN